MSPRRKVMPANLNSTIRMKAQQPPRAAIYARYSTDEQRPESIEDQIATCRRFCASKGWVVAGTYADAAMTGSSSHRPEYQRLWLDSERDAFDVIVVEALDRLSRRLSDVASFHDRLSFRGVKLYASDRGEISSLMAGVLGAVAQSFLDDLRHKTKRGLRGKVLSGLSAGSLGYGYAVNPAVKGARPIIEAEAQIVRRIFDLYANGASPRAVVATLNLEHVPGPGGRPWGDTTIRGQVDRGTGILNNAAYVGRIEWNRCSYIRDPSTGKRVARPNPRDEWEVMNAPELRIVDDELWNRVKARQQEVRTEMARDESGQALNRAHRAKHLLSGLIFCGECGAPFAMRDSAHYGCSNFRSKGICSHSDRIKRADLEKTVGDAIRHQWLNEATLQQMRAELIAEREKALGSSDGDKAKLKAALGRVESQSARIASAIADAGHNPALIAKLAELEKEAERLRAGVEEIDAAITPEPAEIAGEVETYIRTVRENIETFLSDPIGRNSAGLRDLIRGMIDKIVVTRRDEESSTIAVHGKFAGVMHAAGLLDHYEAIEKAPALGATGASLSVVAGAGFEPPAFRL